MERREDDKIQSNNYLYCICVRYCVDHEKIGGYFVSLILQTRARNMCRVFFFTIFVDIIFIHSIQKFISFFSFFLSLMERPRKWRRKIGSINIVYMRDIKQRQKYHRRLLLFFSFSSRRFS